MAHVVFLLSLAVCFSSALLITLLHFWMKIRLLNASLPVKWFMTPADDFRMWRCYRTEAPSRNWPLWPFYAYRILLGIFAASGIALVANMNEMQKFLQ